MTASFVKALPPPEIVTLILKHAGYYGDGAPATPKSARDIAVAVFGKPHRVVLIRNVLADPDRWDPVPDEVAVARALQGDRAVWENLTHYERREVMLAVHARRVAEREFNAQDKAGYGPWAGDPVKVLYRQPVPRVPAWLEQLADAWGMTPARVIGQSTEYAKAEVL